MKRSCLIGIFIVLLVAAAVVTLLFIRAQRIKVAAREEDAERHTKSAQLLDNYEFCKIIFNSQWNESIKLGESAGNAAALPPLDKCEKAIQSIGPYRPFFKGADWQLMETLTEYESAATAVIANRRYELAISISDQKTERSLWERMEAAQARMKAESSRILFPAAVQH